MTGAGDRRVLVVAGAAEVVDEGLVDLQRGDRQPRR
jgi:hypothetical protein